jgi:hypothetical protein
LVQGDFVIPLSLLVQIHLINLQIGYIELN